MPHGRRAGRPLDTEPQHSQERAPEMSQSPPRPTVRPASLLFHIPVLGWMLREVADNPEQAALPFAINILLAIALATWLIGPIVIMALAMALVPVVLGTILLMSADFGRSL